MFTGIGLFLILICLVNAVLPHRGEAVNPVLAQHIKLRLTAFRVDQPVFGDSAALIFIVLITPVTPPAFGTDDLHYQIGGTIEVVRLEGEGGEGGRRPVDVELAAGGEDLVGLEASQDLTDIIIKQPTGIVIVPDSLSGMQ